MTLETLAKDIASSAQTEANAILKEANTSAKEIIAEAEAKAAIIRDKAGSRASREAEQLAREIVASAQQSNKKDELVARRVVLDATFEEAKGQLADPALSGRASILKGLMAQADELAVGDFTVRPVAIDRAALSGIAGSRVIGDDVEGLGGFILEATDGSVSFDMRFDKLLDQVWSDKRTSINATLFN
ncbi:MAG: V-type ATP synthase subunit E family protein [Candidatus Poseidoniaceae archaeon]